MWGLCSEADRFWGNVDYRGRIWIEGDDPNTALEAVVSVVGGDFSISSRTEMLGSWRLDDIHVERHGDRNFKLTVEADQLVFRPDGPDEASSFARELGITSGLADRIRATAVSTPTSRSPASTPLCDDGPDGCRGPVTERDGRFLCAHHYVRSKANDNSSRAQKEVAASPSGSASEARTIVLPRERTLEGAHLSFRVLVLIGLLFPFFVVSCGTFHVSIEGWRLATGVYEDVDTLMGEQGLDSSLLPESITGSADGSQAGDETSDPQWWVLAAACSSLVAIALWIFRSHRALGLVLDAAAVLSLLVWRNSWSDSISAGQVLGVTMAMGTGYWMALVAAIAAFLTGSTITWGWGWSRGTKPTRN